jgi:hypothetical protein
MNREDFKAISSQLKKGSKVRVELQALREDLPTNSPPALKITARAISRSVSKATAASVVSFSFRSKSWRSFQMQQANPKVHELRHVVFEKALLSATWSCTSTASATRQRVSSRTDPPQVLRSYETPDQARSAFADIAPDLQKPRLDHHPRRPPKFRMKSCYFHPSGI